MNYKKLTLAAIAIVSSIISSAEIKFSFADEIQIDRVIITRYSLDNILNAKSRSELIPLTSEITSSNGVFSYQSPSEWSEQYIISIPQSEEPVIAFFANPSDNVDVYINLNSDGRYTAIATGTELLDGINQIDKLTEPLIKQLIDIRQGNNTTDNFEEIYAKYQSTFAEYVRTNSDSHAAAYALLNCSEEDFINLFDTLGENAKKSIYYPIVKQEQPRIAQQLEKIRKQKELESGSTLAPKFSLPDLNGKIVTLADFNGKWIVLDFWGSWCGWCIKGFPKMKEYYQKYAGKFEIIGIDCGDTPQQWADAVKKYELPWVNLYNDSANEAPDRIDIAYGVQGFPTKVIISPDGKIKKIITGEDPQFYLDLDKFLSE